MILNILEEISRFSIDGSIREEALGDLWERNHRLQTEDSPLLWRYFVIISQFFSVVRASILIKKENVNELVSATISKLLEPIHEEQSFDVGEIEPETLAKLKRYCERRLSGNQRTSIDKWRSAVDKARVIRSEDDKLLWLIRRADRVIAQCRSVTGRQGDSESVINSLVLSQFIRRLEVNPPTEMDVQKFYELVRDVRLTRDFIDRYVDFRRDTFGRKLIVRTWSLSVYVISWEPGQFVKLHHHGNALDAIRIIEGEMAHWVLPPGTWERDIPFEGCEVAKSTECSLGTPQTFTTGDIALVDRRHGHRIANLSNERLTTLHFRFGQPPEDDHWRSTVDELKFVWEQVEFVWNQPQAVL